MMGMQAVLSEGNAALNAFAFDMPEPVTPHFVSAAFDEDPRKADKMIYAVGDEEYLIPVTHLWVNSTLTHSEVRLDQVLHITDRPQKTRRIPQMALSAKVGAEVRAALAEALAQWFRPQPGYDVVIVE